jgi:hypothetical protein
VRVWFNPPQKIVIVITDIKIILAYSAINNKANLIDPYSKLNPETNSDSPSAKSKGLRLVSAKQEINHTQATGGNKKANQTLSWCVLKVNKSISE